MSLGSETHERQALAFQHAFVGQCVALEGTADGPCCKTIKKTLLPIPLYVKTEIDFASIFFCPGNETETTTSPSPTTSSKEGSNMRKGGRRPCDTSAFFSTSVVSLFFFSWSTLC